MLDFIVNPIAGGKRGKKIKNTLNIIESYLKERNVEYKIHYTEYKGHAKEVTKNLTENGRNASRSYKRLYQL